MCVLCVLLVVEIKERNYNPIPCPCNWLEHEGRGKNDM